MLWIVLIVIAVFVFFFLFGVGVGKRRDWNRDDDLQEKAIREMNAKRSAGHDR